MNIEIEKGIPLPKRKQYIRKDPVEYPFEKMDIGDSFYIEGTGTTTSIYTVVGKASTRLGKTFAVRLENMGYRVWRIS